MPDGSSIPPMYDTAPMESMHRRLVQYGLCFLRGGSRVSDSARQEIVAIVPGAAITGEGENDPNGKRVVTTNYAESEIQTRRDWTQPEIDEARLLHALVNLLPIQRRLVVQCFYAGEYAEIWSTLGRDRQAAILYELTHWPNRPRGVNAGIDDHNKECGDHVPHIVHELYLTILHRALRELLARMRGLST